MGAVQPCNRLFRAIRYAVLAIFYALRAGAWCLFRNIPNRMRSQVKFIFRLIYVDGKLFTSSTLFPMINENLYLLSHFHGAFPM